MLETYPNVNFDLTPGWEMFLGFSKDIDAWQAFFTKYQDRILFGTDSNNTKGADMNKSINLLVRMATAHDKTEFKMPCYGGHIIKGLALDEKILDKIYFKNYSRFVGEPKAVNTKMILSAAQSVYADIKDLSNENMQCAKAWLEEFFEREGI